MLHTQEGHFINGKIIEEWKITPLKKGDLHCVVAVGASEHPFHFAPKESCENILAKIVTEVEIGFEHTLDFRGVDAEHIEAAQAAMKPAPRSRSKSTTT